MTILGVTASSITKINPSYESIASASGTGASSTITFSSIPQTYSHLQLRWICRTTSVNTGMVDLALTMNGGITYYYHAMKGTGASVAASAASANRIILQNAGAADANSANYVAVGFLDLHDYTSTNKFKTVRYFCGASFNNTLSQLTNGSGIYQSTSAVTSLSFYDSSGDFLKTDTQVALYGIKGS